MATPTRAEVETQFSNAIHILESLREYAHVNATNYRALEDTLFQSFESDFVPEMSSGVAAHRANLAAAISRDVARGMLSPHLRSYGRFIEASETDDLGIFKRLYDDFIANTLRVTSRQFTFGSPVAGGGNAGDGVINRLNQDDQNFDIENQTADGKVADIVADCDRDPLGY